MAINFPDNRDQLVPPQPSGPIQTGDVYVYNGTTYVATVLSNSSVRWDAAVSAGSDAYVLKVGDTMTGQLTLPGGGTGSNAATVDQITSAIPAALWQRDGGTSTLSPATANDNLNQGSGNITTTGNLGAAAGTFTGDVSAANFTTTGDVQATSLNSGPLAGLRNLLINGCFRNWQRGAGDTPVPADFPTYRADRWFVRRQGQTGGTPRQGYYKINTNKYGHEYQATGLTSSAYVAQIVESTNCQHLRGQTLTFSIYANAAPTLALNYRNSSGTDVNMPGTTVSLGGNRYSLTVTLPDEQIGAGFNQQGIQVLCWYNGKQDPLNDGLWRTWDAQLEPGPVATPFEMRPIGTELALCQRYFYQTPNGFSKTMYPVTGSGQNGATMGFRACYINTPVQMRTQPSVTAVVPSASSSIQFQSPAGAQVYISGQDETTPRAVTSFTADAEL